MTDALLDTTFFIDLHRGHLGAHRVWDKIEAGNLTASFSTITAFELWLGEHVSRAEELFYLALFNLLEEATLTVSAAVRAALWLRSFPENLSERFIRDALIAASALERGEVVYTQNVRDFQRFYADVKRY